MAHGNRGDDKPPVRGPAPSDDARKKEQALDPEEQETILRYSGAQLDAWHKRLLDMFPTRDLATVETPVPEVSCRSTSVYAAWEHLDALLDERSKGSVRLYLEGLVERPPGAKEIGVSAVVGGVALLALGWAVALPAAAAVAVVGSARKTRKLLKGGGPAGRPDLPEFRNDWAVQCHRFVEQVRGYQVRAAAIERMRHFRLMPQTSEWYARLLFGARERLERNLRLLLELQPTVFRMKKGRATREDILASDEQNRLLRQMLPYWDPELDWLPLEDGVIHPGDEFERLRKDVMHLESLEEAAAEARRNDRDAEWEEILRDADRDEGPDQG